MKQIFILIFYLLRSLTMLVHPGGRKSLAIENIMLRKQLIILNRRQKRTPVLNQWEKLSLAFLTSIMNPKRLLKAAILIKPSTLIKFHKALIERKYSRLFSNKSKCKSGPRGPSQELIQAVIAMKHRNPRFGCRRIAMQINNIFGLNINKDIIWRILAKHYKPVSNDDGPSWLSFIGNMKDSLWSVDFFRCESILLKSHWVMVVMDQYTRRIIDFAVHTDNLNGLSACIMFNKIIYPLHPKMRFLTSQLTSNFKCSSIEKARNSTLFLRFFSIRTFKLLVIWALKSRILRCNGYICS
jgi:putative transposase